MNADGGQRHGSRSSRGKGELSEADATAAALLASLSLKEGLIMLQVTKTLPVWGVDSGRLELSS